MKRSLWIIIVGFNFKLKVFACHRKQLWRNKPVFVSGICISNLSTSRAYRTVGRRSRPCPLFRSANMFCRPSDRGKYGTLESFRPRDQIHHLNLKIVDKNTILYTAFGNGSYNQSHRSCLCRKSNIVPHHIGCR